MASCRFAGQLGGEIVLDICFSCRGIWFDEHESAQLAAAGVLELFRLLHEREADARQPWQTVLRCPRCHEQLLHRLDSTRTGRFAYHRCPQRHGRYSAFSAFLIEKGFVRQLSRGEIANLAHKVETIRCSGCGAALDIRRDSVCGHCRSPIVMLDANAVRKALAEFGAKAEREQHVDPLAVADALLANQIAQDRLARRDRSQPGSNLLAELVVGGIAAVWNLLIR